MGNSQGKIRKRQRKMENSQEKTEKNQRKMVKQKKGD